MNHGQRSHHDRESMSFKAEAGRDAVGVGQNVWSFTLLVAIIESGVKLSATIVNTYHQQEYSSRNNMNILH
jgi:hypothetical protein